MNSETAVSFLKIHGDYMEGKKKPRARGTREGGGDKFEPKKLQKEQRYSVCHSSFIMHCGKVI